MSEIDTALTAWINAWAGLPAVDLIMSWVSAIGVALLVLAVALQWWVPRSDRSTRHVLVAAGLSFLLGLGFNQLILLFVQRVRPYDVHLTHLLIDRSADFSFPSDHATAGFAIAAAFLLHALPRRGLVFLAAAGLMAVSRVYVGTHYVSDVLGGAATGVVAAILVRMTYREGSRLDRLVTSIL
jgi:undecaprenyl-diphosphatase